MTTTVPTYKRCRSCGTDKPLSHYFVNLANTDGRRGTCITCERINDWSTITVCTVCGASIPTERRAKTDTCSRACLCVSVGLAPDFDPDRYGMAPRRRGPLCEVTPQLEREVKDVLDAVILSAVARVRP